MKTEPESSVTSFEDQNTAKMSATKMKLSATAQSHGEDEAIGLRGEIVESLPYAEDWLVTPHQLLAGDSPEQRIVAGDLEAVRNLLHSILYVGVV